MSGTLILARHAQSEGNKLNIFTGRRDLPLSDLGRIEAVAIAAQIRAARIQIDVIFTSSLTRTRQTADIVAAELRLAVPIITAPAFDERDYGQLTGMNKDQAAETFGAQQVLDWRRSYEQRPPDGESLHDTRDRVVAYYKNEVVPRLRAGENVLVIAHGNSLRALVMELESIAPANIANYEIATGEIVTYKLASPDDGAETIVPLKQGSP